MNGGAEDSQIMWSFALFRGPILEIDKHLYRGLKKIRQSREAMHHWHQGKVGQRDGALPDRPGPTIATAVALTTSASGDFSSDADARRNGSDEPPIFRTRLITQTK
jgi:hypothetical protein